MSSIFRLFDTHAHLCDDILWPQYSQIIDKMAAAHVDSTLVICQSCEELERFTLLRDYAHRHGILLLAASGSGPHDDEARAHSLLPALKNAARDGLLHAIGETGLDRHHNIIALDVQEKRFLTHIELALEYGLPLIIHCRLALEPLITILDRYYLPQIIQRAGLFHCFTEGIEQAKEVMKRGFLVSLSGIVTYRSANALHTLAREIPETAYVLETDSPYLTPGRDRQLLNHPANLLLIAQHVAQLRDCSVLEVAQQTNQNAQQLFLSTV